jgi:hypothetical protein
MSPLPAESMTRILRMEIPKKWQTTQRESVGGYNTELGDAEIVCGLLLGDKTRENKNKNYAN